MPQRCIGTARQAVCSHTQQLHIRIVQHSKLGEARISGTRVNMAGSAHTHAHTYVYPVQTRTLTHTEYIHMPYCVSKECADTVMETHTLTQMFRDALHKDITWQPEEVR